MTERTPTSTPDPTGAGRGLPQSEEWDDQEYTHEGVAMPVEEAYPIPKLRQEDADADARQAQFEQRTREIEAVVEAARERPEG